MTPETDNTPGLPPLPDPFPGSSAASPPADPGRTRRGCLIAGLGGCGLMLVLVIVGFAVMATQVDRMLEFVLDFSRERVEAGFPEDATEAERDRLRLAFDSVLEHYRSRQATAADNRRLQTALTDALRRLERGVFDRDDLQRLTERMERIGSPGPED